MNVKKDYTLGPFKMEINVLSESEIEILLPPQIDPDLNRHLHELRRQLLVALGQDILEIVVGYHKAVLYLDPYEKDIWEVFKRLDVAVGNFKMPSKANANGREVKIPVCYHESFALDLEDLCQYSGLSSREVINLHTSGNYHVYMVGFLPGFPYLGGLDIQIHMPRKAKPRKEIFKGAVGIAGGQTGVYPLASPGGWQIIGRTPLDLFDINQDPPSVINPGDKVIFIEITKEAYDQIQEGRLIWEIYA